MNGRFTTVKPAATVNGQFQLADGQTVGIAAPIILQFNAPIKDKAAVERALIVTTDPPTEGSWAWLPDEAKGARAHWRTREYYQPGTTVHVDAKLYGVAFGDGAYGAEDLSLQIAIGRRQIVKADAQSHRIQVVTDEGVIMDFPCSYGEADKPRNITRSGTHVVSEKYSDFYMTNPAAGYANVHERYAVRISNNGEFIHCNPQSIGAQGNTNVTNGCINLNLENAIRVLQQRHLRRSRRSHRHVDSAVVLRRRHLGLGGGLGHLEGDVGGHAGAASPMGIPTSAPATPSTHRRCRVRRRLLLAPAAEPRRAGLVPRPDHDQVQVDVRRP